MQNGESSRDLLLSVTNRKALAPGGHSPRPPPPHTHTYKTFTTLLPVTVSQLDPQLVSILIGYLLTNGLNCLTVKYLSHRLKDSLLAFGIKDCSSKTRFISSIIRLLCPALWHYVREHICVLVFAFVLLSCKNKSALNRIFSTESYRNWRKSVKILKNMGLFLKNKQKY